MTQLSVNVNNLEPIFLRLAQRLGFGMFKRTGFRFWATFLFSLLLYSLILPNFVVGLFAQDQKPLRLSVEVAKFRGDSTHTKLEIYHSIGRQGLTYKKSNIGFIARFQLETKIIQKDSVNDRHSSNRMPVDISLFSEDSLVLSDIQFATHIKKASNLNNPFVKNNLHVMPNPQSLYGDGLENLTFYAELYNLDFSNGFGGTYSVDYIIENGEGKILNRIHGRQRPKQSKNAAIYTSFDISSLKSNRYILKLDVTDNNTNRRANISKNFSIFRRADALAFQAEQEGKVYREFDESTLQNYFDQISYIATEEEKTIFKQLELQGKREFLFQFWQGRDPSPGTPENEFKDDYIQRLLKVKIHFSSSDTEGWQTDRGRILLIYGTPDFIDREPALSDKNAHEIWNYETLNGRSMFVFIDLNDNGKYRLIHSDYRGEMSNPDWQSYLYK